MALSEEQVKSLSGLSRVEVDGLVERDGYNELPGAKRRSVLRIVFEVMREPMFILLVACGSIYLALGSAGEAIMLLGFVAVVMAITIYQENRTENAVQALRDLSSPRALVIRDGEQQRIPGREVVRGDLIILNEGDRVPADAELLWVSGLSCDESLLTGESVPVRKSPASDTGSGSSGGLPGGDDLPFVYSGTLIS